MSRRSLYISNVSNTIRYVSTVLDHNKSDEARYFSTVLEQNQIRVRFDFKTTWVIQIYTL